MKPSNNTTTGSTKLSGIKPQSRAGETLLPGPSSTTQHHGETTGTKTRQQHILSYKPDFRNAAGLLVGELGSGGEQLSHGADEWLARRLYWAQQRFQGLAPDTAHWALGTRAGNIYDFQDTGIDAPVDRGD